MPSVLSVNGITKRYEGFQLGPLDIEIEPGLVVGLIGPNGAGKSTALNIMAGLIRPDAGSASVAGNPVSFDDPKYKFDLGYIGDEPVFYERWTGLKNLTFIAQFYPDWSQERALELAKRFDLDLNKRANDLSRGNRTKLYLITALARSPKLMLFDEPTSGLDPVVRSEMLDVLWEIIERGEQAILYSTHILSDINRIADELIFLIDGKVLLRCGKDDLIEKWRRLSFAATSDNLKLEGVVSHKHENGRHIVITPDFEKTERQLTGMGIGGVETVRMSIDEIAVQIMKGGR